MWTKAEAFFKKDKYLAPLVEKYGPCKMGLSREGDYFVDLVDAITGQQLSVKAASTIFKRVEGLCKGFITPKKIKNLGVEDLRGCGLSYAKISYLRDLAERVLDGRLQIEKLSNFPDEEVRQELTAVKGIGVWTANMFLMFTLGRPDIFPIEDLGIRKGMDMLLNRSMTGDQMSKFALRWSPYRSVASWYIWKVLDNEPLRS